MSLLQWFAAKKPSSDAAANSDIPRNDQALFPPRTGTDGAPVSARRGERNARREQLFAVIRECMTRAGVLSSTYKFKVLSLDGWGRQFLVMIDLTGMREEPAQKRAEVEAMVAQAAKSRHEILVKAVYWRQQSRAAASALPPTLNERVPTEVAPAPVEPAVRAPRAVAQAAGTADEVFEPINKQELAAFRSALSKGTKPAPAPAPTGQSYTLLTGFENTEMHEDLPAGPALSSTQYGDLR